MTEKCIVCNGTGYTEDFLGMNAPSKCQYCSSSRYKAIDSASEVTKLKIEQLEKDLNYLKRSLKR